MEPLSVLFWCDYRPEGARMVADHIEAVARYSRHRLIIFSGIGDLPDGLDLSRFDAVLIHYSVFIGMDAYVSPLARARLRAFSGVKAMFIQDEYRAVDQTVAAMAEIGIDLCFTCVPPHEVRKVYDPTRLPVTHFVNVLTGYVADHLIGRRVPTYVERPIDIGYRGRVYPAWHGALGRERVAIAEAVGGSAAASGFVCDISVREEDRVYGEAWHRFLENSKATLGTESGASVFDFDGTIQKRVEDHVLRDPSAGYERLRELYFADQEGRIDLAQISPRCFEAIAARTLLILYEGRYSGLLEPWAHYVPLRKDHANMAEVLAVVQDIDHAETLIDRAYREVLLRGDLSDRAAVASADRDVSAAYVAKGGSDAPRARPYAVAEAEAVVGRWDVSTRRLKARAREFAAHTVRKQLRRLPPERGQQVEEALRRLLRPRQPLPPPPTADEAGLRLLLARAAAAHARASDLFLAIIVDEAGRRLEAGLDAPEGGEGIDAGDFEGAFRAEGAPTAFAWRPSSSAGLARVLGAEAPLEIALTDAAAAELVPLLAAMAAAGSVKLYRPARGGLGVQVDCMGASGAGVEAGAAPRTSRAAG